MTDALRAALTGLFDDAGSFPPAAKPLAGAVEDHRRARAGEFSWLVGRFLCPAAAIAEYAALIGDADTWQTNVVLKTGLGDDQPALDHELDQVFAHALQARVAGLEVRLPTRSRDASIVAELTDRLAPLRAMGQIDVWFEVPLDATMSGWVEAIAEEGRRVPDIRVGAKIRCGGLTAAAFPAPESVAAFLEAVGARQVPFKATAGLHHPFPEPHTELGVVQYGFINLLAASGVPDAKRSIVLADPGAMLADGPGAVTVADLVRGRAALVAIGSCSLDEPVDDLIARGLLRATTEWITS